MFVRNKIGLLATTGALGLIAAQAHAVPITFASTGAGAPGTVDANYRIVAIPGSTTVNNDAFITQSASNSAGNFPLPDYWFADNSGPAPNSKWISPQVSYASTSDASGYYAYRTTFNSALGNTLSGRFWADDAGNSTNGSFAGVFLNGVRIGNAANGYSANTPQTFSSFFGGGAPITTLAGTNTLTFVVYNGATRTDFNPTGLRVEADAVPEPAFFQMSALLVGGGLVALRQKRRRK